MKRKDVRSLILSMVLGDGCLYYLHRGNKTYGGFMADHGIAQSDYVAWKAAIVGKLMNRDIKTRVGHKGKSVQFQVSDSRFKAWRKFCYPNGKKDLTRILPFIKHPEFALAIWLMDDGYVEPSISKLATGKKVNYGARLRIFTESQPIEDHEYFIKWFETTLGIKPKIHLYKCKKRNNQFPFLKFNQADSLIIWEKIRDTVLALRSMKYKFRHLEDIYQKRILQRIPPTK